MSLDCRILRKKGEDQKCNHPEYKNTNCLAECCKLAPGEDWEKCPYEKEEEVKIEPSKETEIVIEEPKIKKKWYSEEDIVNMAKMCYGESMNLPVLHTDFGDRSATYQSAEAMWAVLNRVDAGYGDISTCIKAKRQFVGYKSDNPVTDELYDLAKLVIEDWATGTEEYRVLLHIFRYFYGDGRHNHFTTKPNGGGVEYNHLIPDPFV